ncbi:MAG: DUF4382 domain-containing protein [Thermodesulfobacteriota bacterium]
MQTILRVLICLALSLGLSACSSSSSDSGASGSGGGQLSLSLTDSAAEDYQAVYVTIQEVRVHPAENAPDDDSSASGKSGGELETDTTEDDQDDDLEDDASWQVVATPEKTYNLLELVNGVMENLGAASLPAGQYTQMRLILGDAPDNAPNLNGQPHPFPQYLLLADGSARELKVPSGYQSGIKLVHGFTITAGRTTELILDFDAARSIVQAGKSGKWLLKPTIKIIGVSTSGGVGGVVTSEGTPAAPLAGALLSAQKPDPGAADDKDKVAVVAATPSDDTGSYFLNLPAGTYNLVAVKEGYQAACSAVTITSGEDAAADFTLTPAATGALEGTVTIQDAEADQEATLSIRRTALCPDQNQGEQAEVATVTVADGGTYDLTLPEGTYTITAWTAGAATVTIADVAVTAGQSAVRDIELE